MNLSSPSSAEPGSTLSLSSDSVLCLSKSDLREWGIDSLFEVSHYQVHGGGLNWQVDIFRFADNGVSHFTTSCSWDSNFVFHRDSFDFTSCGMSQTFSHNFDEEGKLSSSGGSGYGAFNWNEFFWVNDTMAIVETTCVGHCGSYELEHSFHHYNPDGLLKYKVYIFREFSGEEEEHFLEDYATFRKELDSLPDTAVDYDTTFYSYGESICESWQVSELPEERTEKYYSKFLYHQIFIGSEPMEAFIHAKTGKLPKVVLMQASQSESYTFLFNGKTGKYF